MGVVLKFLPAKNPKTTNFRPNFELRKFSPQSAFYATK